MRFEDRGSRFTIMEPRFREIGKSGVTIIASSDSAHFDQLDGVVSADNLRGNLRGDGRHTNLYADSGTYSVNATTAVIRGNVRIQNDQGYEFRTTEAVYRHEQRVLSATGPFEADGNGLRLNGTGLHYDLEADKFVIDQNVSASIERFEF